MPGYDETGPAGWGPMTGGGRGTCGKPERGVRRGFERRMGRSGICGRGMGAGRGWGASPFPASGTSTRNISKTEELEILRAESEQINLTLGAIQKRMEALENQDE